MTNDHLLLQSSIFVRIFAIFCVGLLCRWKRTHRFFTVEWHNLSLIVALVSIEIAKALCAHADARGKADQLRKCWQPRLLTRDIQSGEHSLLNGMQWKLIPNDCELFVLPFTDYERRIHILHDIAKYVLITLWGSFVLFWKTKILQEYFWLS